MNDKLLIKDIIKEIDSIKKYTNELWNNVQGEKFENYLNKVNQDIIKLQDKAEELYIKLSK